jgi:hypothetical protein
MLRFNFMVRAKYYRKIIGKVLYLHFKADFHGYSSI